MGQFGKSTRISIVTPSFNQAEYLGQTLLSVLDQGYSDLEYVVIDAGSKDGSLEIIKGLESRLAYWVSEPDKGHADALNKGFAHTTGEIMAWINSSDVYYPWTLQTVSEVFSDVPEAKWITGVATHLDKGTAPQSFCVPRWNKYDFLSGRYKWIQQESVFWRRGLWEDAGGRLNPDLDLACDFELWLRFMKLAPLYHVDTILAGFRYHGDSRGACGMDRYQVEAREHFDRFRRSFGLLDRLRAQLIRGGRIKGGLVARKCLRAIGLMPWYGHMIIQRDFQNKRWKAMVR